MGASTSKLFSNFMRFLLLSYSIAPGRLHDLVEHSEAVTADQLVHVRQRRRHSTRHRLESGGGHSWIYP
jgi:hypothetical protein